MTRGPSAFRAGIAAVALASLAACAPDESVVAPVPGAQIITDAQSALQGGGRFVAGEMIVKFREGATTEARGRALGRVGGQVAERIVTASMRAHGDREGITVVRTGMAVSAAVSAVRGDSAVEYAEPNWIYTVDATSNDLYATNGSLWGMYGASTSPANQFGSGAAAAWAAGKTDCSDVWVGIIDEGYMYTHEDLAANAATNPGETAGNGIDDDGNGLVDDVYGWDFAGGNNSVYDGTGDDHGTHVAGTIGGVGGNGKGVAGVCWNVKLLNAKFLGATGGSTTNAIKAVDYFTDLKTRHGINLVATNNSWGGGGFSQALKDAIDRAGAANILFIAAAGNSATNNDVTASYPSGYTSANIIAVASITSTGALSSFSQYGATTVDIGAPGSGIWSTVPASTGSSYASYNGTSMATPHVTGAAALYKSLNPTADAAAVKAGILNAATPTTSLTGKVLTGGRLNVAGFVGGGTPVNQAPVASFTFSCTQLACTFNGTGSSDPDGTIASYAWSFGDASSATGATTSRTYAAAGTYTVTLTVTDNGGATSTTSKTVTVTSSTGPTIVLNVTVSLRNRSYVAAMNWSGAAATVNVFVNGANVGTVTGTSTSVNLGKTRRTSTFKVCNAGTTTCSNTVSVTY